MKKEIQEVRSENFQLELKLESLSVFIFDCFEHLGQKLDKDLNNLKDEIKEEIMYSKDRVFFKKGSLSGLKILGDVTQNKKVACQ